MAQMASAGFWPRVRFCVPTTGAMMILATLAFPACGLAEEPVKAETSLLSGRGYARFVITFAEDVGTKVEVAGTIVVIRFERPIKPSIGKIHDDPAVYVEAFNLDPDISVMRMSLDRKAIVYSTKAGKRLFVDLLPEAWSGPPPNLPADVVRDGTMQQPQKVN